MGTFIAWYLDRIGNKVTLYGRNTSVRMNELLTTRKNEYLTLEESVTLTQSYENCKDADIIIIFFGSQTLQEVADDLAQMNLIEKLAVRPKM